jgi:hypothetical protein
MNDWEVATGGNLDMQYAGTTASGVNPGTAPNRIAWEESDSLGSGVLGVCYTDWNGITLALTDADIEFNGFNFTWDDESLIRRVALHELGHAVGMGHEPPPPVAIMNPSLASATELQPDDITGITTLYGLGAGTGDGVFPLPPPPPPPPPPPAPAPIPRATGGDGGTVGGGGGPSSGGSDDDDDNVAVEDDDEDYGGGLSGNYRKYKAKYCIVATASFGSHDATRVSALRTLRDRSLRQTAAGARAVSLYERSAAPVAQVVGESQTLRAFFRRALSR